MCSLLEYRNKFLGGTGDWIQGLEHAMPAFYYLSLCTQS
jgi:hypothetical protein